MHHQIDYIEFPSSDIAKTKSFYATVFGWKFTDYGPDYTAFEDGRLSGGFTTDRIAQPNGILIVLYSNNLEKTKTSIEQHQGKITKDIFSFPGGKRFHFSDPSGNEIAVWSK